MKLPQRTLLSRVLGRPTGDEAAAVNPSPRGRRVSQDEIRLLFADVLAANNLAKQNTDAVDEKKAA